MMKMNNIFMQAALQATTAAQSDEEGKVFMISTIIKVGGFCVIIMALIYILAVFTPKIAAKVDKIIENNKNKSNGYRTDGVRGIYDLPPVTEKKETVKNETESDEEKVNDERGHI